MCSITEKFLKTGAWTSLFCFVFFKLFSSESYGAAAYVPSSKEEENKMSAKTRLLPSAGRILLCSSTF